MTDDAQIILGIALEHGLLFYAGSDCRDVRLKKALYDRFGEVHGWAILSAAHRMQQIHPHVLKLKELGLDRGSIAKIEVAPKSEATSPEPGTVKELRAVLNELGIGELLKEDKTVTPEPKTASTVDPIAELLKIAERQKSWAPWQDQVVADIHGELGEEGVKKCSQAALLRRLQEWNPELAEGVTEEVLTAFLFQEGYLVEDDDKADNCNSEN